MPEPVVAANPNPNNPAGVPPVVKPVVAPVVKPVAVETWAGKTFTKPELKSHAILSRFKGPDDLGDSYLALERRFSDKNARSIPGPDATDEDRADFFKWRGRPEKVEEYSLNNLDKIKEMLPDGAPIEEAFVKAAFDVMHEMGLNDSEASGVVKMYLAQNAMAIEQLQTQLEAGIEEVKKEWGHAYDEKLAVAGRAVDQLALGDNAIPGLAELMDPEKGDPRFASNPVLIRLFNFLGTMMGEDQRVEGQQRTEQQTGDLGARKKELMKPDGPYWKEADPLHKATVAEVQEINKQLVPGAA